MYGLLAVPRGFRLEFPVAAAYLSKRPFTGTPFDKKFPPDQVPSKANACNRCENLASFVGKVRPSNPHQRLLNGSALFLALSLQMRGHIGLQAELLLQNTKTTKLHSTALRNAYLKWFFHFLWGRRKECLASNG